MTLNPGVTMPMGILTAKALMGLLAMMPSLAHAGATQEPSFGHGYMFNRDSLVQACESRDPARRARCIGFIEGVAAVSPGYRQGVRASYAPVLQPESK